MTIVTNTALAGETQVIWWVTLGIGLVVAVVVVALLHMLLSAVNAVRGNVTTLWDTATGVARNTATSWQLERTATMLDELKTEATRHDALLSGDGTGQPSEKGAWS